MANINTTNGKVMRTTVLKNTQKFADVAPITQVLVDKFSDRDTNYKIVTATKKGIVSWSYDSTAGTVKEVNRISVKAGITITTLSPRIARAEDLPGPPNYFAYVRSDGTVSIYTITAAGRMLFSANIKVDPPAQALQIGGLNLIDAVTKNTITQLKLSSPDGIRVTLTPTRKKLDKPLTNNPLASAHPVSSGMFAMQAILIIGESDGSIRRFDSRLLGKELDPEIRKFNPVPID